MHGDLRGFYGAPVTYAFTLAVGAASSASLVLDREHVLALDRDAVFTHFQYWRLVSSQLTFNQELAVSLGLYALFQFRVLERQLGSRTFGSFLVFVLVLAGALELVALTSVPWLAKMIPGGPYAVLGALVVYFHKFIPKLRPRTFSVWGLHFSDKTSTYFVFLVLLARDLHTMIPFVAGSLFGYLFSSTTLGRVRLPSFLCSVGTLVHPLFRVIPPSTLALQRQRRALEAQRRVDARLNRSRPGQGFRDQLLPGAGGIMPGGTLAANGLGPPPMAAAPPSEDAIQQLLALGFDRDHAIQALEETHNNVEASANRLLNDL